MPAMLFDSSERIVKRLIAAINSDSLDGVSKLITDDIVLIDSLGSRLCGRDEVLGLFQRMIEHDAQHRIIPASIIRSQRDVLVSGKMQSSDDSFVAKAQRRFRILGRKVSEVQSYRGAGAASIVRYYSSERVHRNRA